ncbi:MAG: hypothetical protein ACPL3A_10350 [Thermoanaerobacteraceae bacterium]
MVKKFLFVLIFIFLIFLNIYRAYGAIENNEKDFVKLIEKKVSFAKDLKLKNYIKEDNEIKVEFEWNKPYKSMFIIYDLNEDKIKCVDYYVDTFIKNKSNNKRLMTKDLALEKSKMLLKELFKSDFIFENDIKDSNYIDYYLDEPDIYKFSFKYTHKGIPVENNTVYIYIDSNNGDVVKLKGCVPDDKIIYEDKGKLNLQEAIEIYKKTFIPQLIYFHYYDNEEKSNDLLAYIPNINFLAYGIDAITGNIIDSKGYNLNEVKSEYDFKGDYKGIEEYKSNELVKEIACNFNIDFNEIKMLQNEQIKDYYLTDNSSLVYNWNYTKLKDGILNINIAVDFFTNKVIHLGFTYWNYNNKNNINISTEKIAEEYIKSHFRFLKGNFVLQKYNSENETVYIFYEKNNEILNIENYISLVVDNKFNLKNINFNFNTYVHKQNTGKLLLTKGEALDIFLKDGLKLSYLITDKKLGKLIYIPKSEYIVNSKTGEKLYFESLKILD